MPLLSAASWAFGAIITRKTGSDHALTTMIYTSIIGAGSLSAVVPFEWINPGWHVALLGIAAGVTLHDRPMVPDHGLSTG